MGVFDDIIEKYGPLFSATYGNPKGGDPDAYARFSRAPINFKDFGMLMRSIGGGAQFQGATNPSGEYLPGDKRISVTVPPGSSFDDVQNIIRHEDTHATLDKVGRVDSIIPQNLLATPPTTRIDKFFMGLMGPSNSGLVDSWLNSRRGGEFNAELPAYMTAYRPGELPGVTAPQSESWVNSYAPTLPSQARDQVLRMNKISLGAAQMWSPPK